MDLLTYIFGKKDPYEDGLTSHWTNFNTKSDFTTETACGYKICYSLDCYYTKVDHQEFKSARMLEKYGEDRFREAVNRHVVLPALHKKGRILRLLERRYPCPQLCYVAEEADNSYIALDISCNELNRELRAAKFTRYGCSLLFIDVRLCTQTEEMIEENYNRMLKIHDITSFKNTPEYMAIEEALLIAAAKRELELEKLFRHGQTDQIHKGENVSIATRLVGRALEIAWKFENPPAGRISLRGYKKNDGFSPEIFPLESNGMCIADSRSNDTMVLSLTAGTDHFFTFVIMRRGSETSAVVESLRFLVRVPTGEELSRVDKLIHTLENQGAQKPVLSKKTSDALNELLSFVEFEESITGVEKQLIDQISGKSYSPEEKEEKIRRLKDVVESLRASNS